MGTQVAALSGTTPEAAFAVQSGTAAYFGRANKVRELQGQAAEASRRHNLNEVAAQFQEDTALVDAEFGNPDLARQTVATVLTFSSGRNAKTLASLAFARAGNLARAEALANELDKRFPSDTELQRYWLPTIRGAIEVDRKNPAGSVRTLQSTSYELGSPSLHWSLYPVYVRGAAYLAMHQGKEAAAEFQKFLDHPSIVLQSPLGALARLGLGRAYVLQNDTAKARTAYQDFFALWKDADPDIPILKQAKAEYAKLQ